MRGDSVHSTEGGIWPVLAIVDMWCLYANHKAGSQRRCMHVLLRIRTQGSRGLWTTWDAFAQSIIFCTKIEPITVRSFQTS